MILIFFACIQSIDKEADEFWDNPLNDHDGDGLTEQDGDCDDRNNEILGPTMWYVDDDNDGYGDPSQGVLECFSVLQNADSEVIYVANSLDCNDGDSTIFPNNAQYEDDDLCVVDRDGDGYGDAIPDVSADAGHDCDDSNSLVYPGYNNEQGSLCILDSDGDGFGQVNAPQPYDSGTDCDDSNKEIYPNQRELCDLVDNSCSGVVDDALSIDAPTWYADADGDGFGSIDYPLSACPDSEGNGPVGYVSGFTDCNDTDGLIHPYLEGIDGGVELCDSEGRDENCDGVSNDPSALDATVWYQDADSDGYGSVFINQRQCDQPSGYVEDNTDCNDSEPNSHPNNSEQCDFIDNDCDGAVDESDAIDAVSYYFDADGDGYGNIDGLTLACPLNQPGNHVTNSEDCNDTDSSQNPAALEQCNGEDDDCDGSTDEDNGTNPAEGSPTWYQDADQDLFGDENSAVVSCLAPTDYVAAAGDCNDSDPFIHPDADEECTEGVDENCDGDPVYGVPTDLLPTWYPDSDGDTYGNPDFVIQLCVQPQNYVPNAGDCNDTDYYVHPLDNAVHSGELESDGVTPYDHRERCNGKVDLCENDLFGDLTPLDIELDDDGDGFVDCALDVDVLFWEHPTESILGGDDCDDTSDYRYPEAPERCNGIYDDCDSLVAFGGFPADEVDNDFDCYVECSGFDAAQWEGGVHSCSYRDINSVTVNETTVVGGDDCNDTAEFTYVGAAPQTDPSTCLTDFDGDGLSDRSWDLCPTEMSYADARYLLQGTVSGANLHAKSGGDVTGDGIWDIIYDGYGAGIDNRIHLLDIGLFSHQSLILDQSTWNYKEDPIASQTYFQFVGDVDGDGLQDFATSNNKINSTYSDAGRIAVYLSSHFGSAFGSETSNNHSVTLTGQATNDYLNDIYPAGDIDQDGYEDVLIKSKTFVDFSPTPSMNLFLGSTLMSEIGNDLNPYNADCHFLETEAGLVMNLDGDSLPDYVLFYRDNLRNGESYIYLGANLTLNSGIYTHSDADRAILGQLYRFLLKPTGAGDINGDGLDDLFLKEYVDGMGFHIYLSETVMNASSELYLEDADVTFRGGETSPDTPFMTTLGDLDADGLDEIIMGWKGDFNGVYNEHYASLFYGSTVMAALNDSVDDSGLPLDEPVLFDVRDADFIFPDVKDASKLGDIDLDGLGEFILSNNSYSFAEAGGGVNGIFSPCEN